MSMVLKIVLLYEVHFEQYLNDCESRKKIQYFSVSEWDEKSLNSHMEVKIPRARLENIRWKLLHLKIFALAVVLLSWTFENDTSKLQKHYSRDYCSSCCVS